MDQKRYRCSGCNEVLSEREIGDEPPRIHTRSANESTWKCGDLLPSDEPASDDEAAS